MNQPNGQSGPRIGGLPPAIRELLNRHMLDDKALALLVGVLNSTPDITSILATGSGPPRLTEADIAEWRQHAFPKWLEQQEVLSACVEMDEEVKALSQMGGKALTEQLADWVSTQYVRQSRRLRENDAEPDTSWRRLREFCSDVAMLRRGEQNAERLSIERQRLLLEEQHTMSKFKRRVVQGLETLRTQIEQNPEAAEAFEAFRKAVSGPFDQLDSKPD